MSIMIDEVKESSETTAVVVLSLSNYKADTVIDMEGMLFLAHY